LKSGRKSVHVDLARSTEGNFELVAYRAQLGATRKTRKSALETVEQTANVEASRAGELTLSTESALETAEDALQVETSASTAA
jgi:hypothetical protein